LNLTLSSKCTSSPEISIFNDLPELFELEMRNSLPVGLIIF